MIKLLKKLVLFFLAFVICDYIIGLGLDIIRNNSPDGRYFKTQYSLEKGKEDIVILGASCAESNIAPYIIEDSLKMTCWNAGRGGQILPFWTCLEKGILNRYTPKIVILDIGANDLSGNLFPTGYERAAFLRPFYHRHKEIHPILNKIFFFEKYFDCSNLYVYNSSYYYLLRPYLFKGLDGKIADKGWKPLTGKMPPIIPHPIPIITSYNLNNETVQLFNEFISNLTTRNCKVFIVISPVFNKKIFTSPTIEYINRLNDVYLLNFGNCKIFTENSRLYRDDYHLNIEGAIKFTTLLVKRIKHEIN